ncbi:MAG: XdhC family protein [bacterium]|nr:XdhC family protein [bacterium]MDE0600727.1 XdhC family protein [bacterium]
MSEDHRIGEVLGACSRMIEERKLGARLTVVEGVGTGASAVVDAGAGIVAGALPADTPCSVMADASTLMGREKSMTLSYGDRDVFIDVIIPRPHLIIFGAVHIAQALCALGRHLDFDITVSDARPAFLTPERFPYADRLLVGWPDELSGLLSFDQRSYVVVLSHDDRFEAPLWPLVLRSPVRYIGAMGSGRTAAARRARLAEAGYSTEEISRIRGPIGLEIGAESPAEVAVAILGEMISTRRQAQTPLDLTGRPRRPAGAGRP